MSDRFHDRYRIPSARASWWDYRRNAAYFVTICTASRECFFGNILDTSNKTLTLNPEETLNATSLHIQNILSPIGEIAQSCWQEIPQHFPYVQLDSFIIMPNHVHGIIIIDKRIGMMVENESIRSMDDPTNSTIDLTNGPVETLHATSLPIQPTLQPNNLSSLSSNAASETNPIPPINIAFSPIKNEFMASISPKWGTLGSIVRSYKSAVSKRAHKINPNFTWQTRFYEIIIRSEQTYRVISDYIVDNPSKWKDDQFYFN